MGSKELGIKDIGYINYATLPGEPRMWQWVIVHNDGRVDVVENGRLPWEVWQTMPEEHQEACREAKPWACPA